MLRKLSTHLTYANVMATIAVFLVLGGGTAVALSGSNTVQSDDLGPGAQVQAADVAANAVNGSDVTDNSITGSDVNEASLDATPLRTRASQGDCQATVAGTGAMVRSARPASTSTRPPSGPLLQAGHSTGRRGTTTPVTTAARTAPTSTLEASPGSLPRASSPTSRRSRRSPTRASDCPRTPSGRRRSPAPRTRTPAT